MTDNIIKHLSAILVRLVQISCEVEGYNSIAIEDVQDISVGITKLGFDMDTATMNNIIQRALGALSMQGITVEFC